MFPHLSTDTIFITPEMFHKFHAVDRKLYAVMVNELMRDPMEAMQAMALWVWLERSTLQNVVEKILALPLFLINEIADEAVICLTSIYKLAPPDIFLPFPPEFNTDQIPLFQGIIKTDISHLFLERNRDVATRGIAKAATEVAFRALADIMEEAIARNTRQQVAEAQAEAQAQQQMLLMQQQLEHQILQQQPPALPSPTLIHSLALGLNHSNNTAKVGINVASSSGTANPGVVAVVPADDRTMFVTFSKGYPVNEWEVRDFFNRIFGKHCIETLHMQEMRPGEEQALFSRIVFYSPDVLKAILNGVTKAKFTINGKHVWMRKFIPKNPRT